MSPSLQAAVGLCSEAYVAHGGDREEALDPTTIGAFAELILQLIKRIQECRNGAPQDVRQPKFGQRLQLRSHLIERMGRREFRAKGERVMNALLQTGRDVTDSDLMAVWREAE